MLDPKDILCTHAFYLLPHTGVKRDIIVKTVLYSFGTESGYLRGPLESLETNFRGTRGSLYSYTCPVTYNSQKNRCCILAYFTLGLMV